MAMKTQYRYIKFQLTERKAKTAVYSCCNNNSGHELGIIKWYPGWRQYCYFPTAQAVYSTGCLEDIAKFINQLLEVKSASSN